MGGVGKRGLAPRSYRTGTGIAPLKSRGTRVTVQPSAILQQGNRHADNSGVYVLRGSAFDDAVDRRRTACTTG